MKKEERKNRIIARGEITGHCHVVTGDVTIENKSEEILIDVHSKAVIRHLLETPWVEEGIETWTKEHKDIQLEKGTYKYVPQVEYDPYEDVIRRVQD